MNKKELKIIQIIVTPTDNYWQGALLGLANNGITYVFNHTSNEWEEHAPNIKLEKRNK